MRILYFCIIMILFTNTIHAFEFYISPDGNDENPGTKQKPFATIQKAQQKIRVLLKNGQKEDITIYLRSGRYQINETIILRLKDSAQKDFKIIYSAYKDENPIISSGKRITDWNKLTKYPKGLPREARGKVWVSDLPETKKGKKRFHVLYDNENRLQRAQSDGFKPTGKHGTRLHRWIEADKIAFPGQMIKDWPNLEDIEIRIRPHAPWLVNYLTLASVNEKKKPPKPLFPVRTG